MAEEDDFRATRGYLGAWVRPKGADGKFHVMLHPYRTQCGLLLPVELEVCDWRTCDPAERHCHRCSGRATQ